MRDLFRSVRVSSLILTWTSAALPFAAPGASSPAAHQTLRQDDAEAQTLLSEERAEADHARRRGEVQRALNLLEEILDENPRDAESRSLRARCYFDLCDWARAQDDAARALADARAVADPAALAGAPAVDLMASKRLRARCARNLAEIHLARGRAREALEVLHGEEDSASPATDARDAWMQARALLDSGERERGLRLLEIGASTPDAQPWDGLMARGLCQRRAGDLEAGSKSLVLADESAKAGEGVEPDVLAAIADLYFEGDREVKEAEGRTTGSLCREALALNPAHESAAIVLFRLHRYNWQRKSRPAHEILDEFLSARPDSIEGLVAGASADLDDGQLKSARERLSRLDQLAPARRDVRALHAALAWIEHKNEECEKILAELASADAKDSLPEREVGRHLLELYRFAEGLPFEKRAVQRDEHDWEAWTQLGRALANTGDEDAAREALDHAQKEAGLRQDAWRKNLTLVLKRMAAEHKHEGGGDLSFAWNADAAEVLSTYLVPFYTQSRKELAARYGFTPGPTAIEVFKKHEDFSVRSTGFEGFPALGVCFGPVVTAVSPLSEMRGTFSWARTSFHEFTHVIHLGLSHNRCPRWITEGLATWEEVHRNPSWTRNMRRELVDALANGDVIPVRELNRAFRGPRILFGYYQGGLLCQMLIDTRGFPPMVRILEAFDRGLDIDQAFAEVYQTTPEDLDRDFHAFAQKLVADLRIEPRWNPSHAARLQISLSKKLPSDRSRIDAWADDWCTLAWSAWQQEKRIDAEEALRVIQNVPNPSARVAFLRGEMALKADQRDKAKEIWQAAIDAGHEDFRVRIALGSLARDAHELDKAEQSFLAAEKDFPGFDTEPLCAELNLVKLYEQQDRTDDAMKARERWLRFESGNYKAERAVAGWHLEKGRAQASLKYFEQANEVDPFRRELHKSWGDALRAAGQHEEALREYRVAQKVPVELDADKPEALTDKERAELMGLEAASLAALSRNTEAAEIARKALELDPDCEIARATLEKLQ